MKAMVFDTIGPPEVLHLADVPKPEPGPGDVLVEIAAIGVNFAEVGRRRGSFPLMHGQALPLVLGYECAGVVERVGSDVSSVAAGNRVLVRAYPHTYAEYAAAPESSVYKIPDELDFVQAAGISGVYTTAWQNIVNRGQLQADETVLVHACASGVGIGNVQVAKYVGAQVIGTASSDEKLEWAKQYGIDQGINYTTDDFVEAVMRITDGVGVPMVVDGVGGETFLQSLKALAPFGRAIVYGVASGQRQATVTLPELWFRNLTVLGAGSGGVDRETLDSIIGLVASGRLSVPVERTWPLEQAAEAHHHLESREVRGKVVLTIG